VGAAAAGAAAAGVGLAGRVGPARGSAAPAGWVGAVAGLGAAPWRVGPAAGQHLQCRPERVAATLGALPHGAPARGVPARLGEPAAITGGPAPPALGGAATRVLPWWIAARHHQPPGCPAGWLAGWPGTAALVGPVAGRGTP